jgi:hypothetical protein
LEPHDVLFVLVVAKAPGLLSEIQEPRLINVDKEMQFDNVADGEEMSTQLYEDSHNLQGGRHLKHEVRL